MAAELAPPQYLRAMVDYLRDREPETWEWYGSVQARDDQAAAVRLQLLKTTIRLERETHADLYEAASRVSVALGLQVPVAFYQAIGRDEANATLVWLSGEAHLVLEGDVLGTLDASERDALIAHELGHVRLWQADDGVFHRALCILGNMAQHPRAEPSIDRSEGIFRRHCEVYADRASLVATGALGPVVSCLVKVGTGLRTVDAAAYLRQADEIFGIERPTTTGITHPETYMRVRALAEWHRGSPRVDDDIDRMLSGPLQLDRPDLFAQLRLEAVTRDLLGLLLEPHWMRSDPVLAHARLFFPDLDWAAAWSGSRSQAQLAADLADASESVQDYVAYILLDFAAIDPSVAEVAVAHGLGIAEALGLRPRFEDKLARELKLSRKSLAALRDKGGELLARAAAQGDSP